MSMLKIIPVGIRNRVLQDWTPDFGIRPHLLIALLEAIGVPLELIAEEIQATWYFTYQACWRCQDSSVVRDKIIEHLAPYGFPFELVWGTKHALQIPNGAIPEGFGSIPVFTGTVLPFIHEVVVLADCETSGPSAEHHRAVEVALLKVVMERRPSAAHYPELTPGRLIGIATPPPLGLSPRVEFRWILPSGWMGPWREQSCP